MPFINPKPRENDERMADEEGPQGSTSTLKRTASERDSPPPPPPQPTKKQKQKGSGNPAKAGEMDEFEGIQFRDGSGHERKYKEEAFVYLSPSNPDVESISDFFSFLPSFPSSDLLVRNSSALAIRSISLTSPLIRSLITCNSYSRMRLVACGVKAFGKQDSGKEGTVYKCKWRIVGEGVSTLRAYLGGSRMLGVGKDGFEKLMKSMYVPIEELKGEMDGLEGMEAGSFIGEVDLGKEDEFSSPLIFPLWKSKTSASLMVEKKEKSALSLRVYGKDVTPHAPPEKQNRVLKREAELAARAEGVQVIEGEDVDEDLPTIDEEVKVGEEVSQAIDE